MTAVTENEKTIEEAQREAEDQLDVLVPSAEPVAHTLRFNGEERTYVQKPLGYFAKLRLFALTGKAVRNVLAAGGPDTLMELLSATNFSAATLQGEDTSELVQVFELVAALAEYLPDYFEDAYCWILGVPQGGERTWAKAAMAAPPDQGGLTDEQGFGILKLFIAQNWDAIVDFFGRQLREIAETAQARKKEDGAEVATG